LSDSPTSPESSNSEPPSPRDAQYGLMFRYLAPPGIFLTAMVSSCYIGILYPHGDSRNLAPCCGVVIGLAGLVYIGPAIKELLLPKGKRVFLVVAADWVSVAAVCWLFLWLIVRFKWFQSMGPGG